MTKVKLSTASGLVHRNSSRGVNLSSTSLSPWGWLSSCRYAEWSVVAIRILVWWFTRVSDVSLDAVRLMCIGSRWLVVRWGFWFLMWASRPLTKHPPFDICNVAQPIGLQNRLFRPIHIIRGGSIHYQTETQAVTRPCRAIKKFRGDVKMSIKTFRLGRNT